MECFHSFGSHCLYNTDFREIKEENDMNRNSYQDVLSDWEKKRDATQKECDDLRKAYEKKLEKLNKIESAISLIMEELDFENFSVDSEKEKLSNESQQSRVTPRIFGKPLFPFEQLLISTVRKIKVRFHYATQVSKFWNNQRNRCT
jgi:septal ring factor EnvC (AmiA/AmiB activator)